MFTAEVRSRPLPVEVRSRLLAVEVRSRLHAAEVRSRLLVVGVRSRLLVVGVRPGSGSRRSPDKIRKAVDCRRSLDGTWLLQKPCCWESSDVDEARKESGVKSIVAGRSPEEIQRIADCCRRSTDSEARRAFGAAR